MRSITCIILLSILIISCSGSAEYEYKTIRVDSSRVSYFVQKYDSEGWTMISKTEVEEPKNTGPFGSTNKKPFWLSSADDSNAHYAIVFKRKKSNW